MDDTNQNQQDEGAELEAPPKFVAALRQIQPPRSFVPPAIDRAVLSAARRHLVRTERTPGNIRRWFFWPAFAAACLVLVAVAYRFQKPSQPQGNLANLNAADLNHDGRVDILDAFQLARQLQTGTKSSAFDLNGDGVADQRDVEVIATQAVKLEKGGPS